MRNISDKIVQKVKTRFGRNKVSEHRAVCDITTDDNIIWRMRLARWIGCKHTRNNYFFSTGNNGYANAPQYYFICTLPVLLNFTSDRIHSNQRVSKELMCLFFFLIQSVMCSVAICMLSPLNTKRVSFI